MVEQPSSKGNLVRFQDAKGYNDMHILYFLAFWNQEVILWMKRYIELVLVM